MCKQRWPITRLFTSKKSRYKYTKHVPPKCPSAGVTNRVASLYTVANKPLLSCSKAPSLETHADEAKHPSALSMPSLFIGSLGLFINFVGKKTIRLRAHRFDRQGVLFIFTQADCLHSNEIKPLCTSLHLGTHRSCHHGLRDKQTSYSVSRPSYSTPRPLRGHPLSGWLPRRLSRSLHDAQLRRDG